MENGNCGCLDLFGCLDLWSSHVDLFIKTTSSRTVTLNNNIMVINQLVKSVQLVQSHTLITPVRKSIVVLMFDDFPLATWNSVLRMAQDIQ